MLGRDGGRKGNEVEIETEMKGGLEVERERGRGRDGQRVGERGGGIDRLMYSWCSGYWEEGL